MAWVQRVKRAFDAGFDVRAKNLVRPLSHEAARVGHPPRWLGHKEELQVFSI
jgi:hypothetical protein